MGWQYNISKNGGDALQCMIKDCDKSHESMARILEQIRTCCQEVVKAMGDADDADSFDFDDLAGVIDGEPELCRAKDVATIKEWGYGSFSELVDARLADFYDCCDSHRVWVGIGVRQMEKSEVPQQGMGGMTL